MLFGMYFKIDSIPVNCVFYPDSNNDIPGLYKADITYFLHGIGYIYFCRFHKESVTDSKFVKAYLRSKLSVEISKNDIINLN